jgi:hypothetical protein
MAAKKASDLETLTALGAEKLARLVLEASKRDAGFKRLVAAAMAGAKGPKAVATVIDRRIAALNRATGFVEWDRTKTFASDLEMTLKAIVDELGPTDPIAAVERALTFIATHQRVFERIDDSQGRIQNIYETAIEALAPLVASWPEAERERLPDLIMAALGSETHGYLPRVASAVAATIPTNALARWDKELSARQVDIEQHAGGSAAGLIACRQAVADARGDLDGYIALEETKHPNSRHTIEIAERLLKAGRAPEALEWVRRKQGRGIGYMSVADLADGLGVQDPTSNRKVSLEARILEALGDKAGAQDLRWSCFESTLDVASLREHIARLDDFAEFEVLDRAFDHASSAKAAYTALRFFIEWPNLERAARLIVKRQGVWDGRHYYALLPAAQALEDRHPAAATILYRALLSDILSRAKSATYAYGAQYFARLNDLAPASDALGIPNLSKHDTFKAEIAKAHGRKAGFWALVRPSG